MSEQCVQKVSAFLEKFNALPEQADNLVNAYANGVAAGYEIGARMASEGKKDSGEEGRRDGKEG